MGRVSKLRKEGRRVERGNGKGRFGARGESWIGEIDLAFFFSGDGRWEGVMGVMVGSS